MFSGTRDKALKPITKLDIEPENCARVTQAIPQEFLSRRECGASRKQNLSISFVISPKRRSKKEAITFLLRGRNEWETGMSKQLAHSEILLALFSDTTYLHGNRRSGSIFVSLCK